MSHKSTVLCISLSLAILTGSGDALACRGDTEHNKNFHGDPDCLTCTCAHRHDYESVQSDRALRLPDSRQQSGQHVHPVSLTVESEDLEKKLRIIKN